jgi:toxin ParE1/3/4
MKVILSSAARRDIREIGDYIAKNSRAAATRYVDVLEGRCMGLGNVPLSCPVLFKLDPPVRRAVEGRYRILYSVRDDHLLIERIIAAARQIGSDDFSR